MPASMCGGACGTYRRVDALSRCHGAAPPLAEGRSGRLRGMGRGLVDGAPGGTRTRAPGLGGRRSVRLSYGGAWVVRELQDPCGSGPAAALTAR